MVSEQEVSAQVSGNILLYENPEPLSKEKHENLGLKETDRPFDFLMKTHFVPLTLDEFTLAAGNFPVIFAGEDHTPLAIMGLRDGENLFVQKDGTYELDCYVPAYIRRYPFIFASEEKDDDRMIVCVDSAAKAISKNPDRPFFENGELSSFSKQSIEFLQYCETQRRHTQDFISMLKEHDLFEKKDVQFQDQNADGSPGKMTKIADYFAIPDAKLADLPGEKLQEFCKNGYMSAIYAHRTSLGNWQRLINRALRRASQPASTENGAQKSNKT